MRSGKGGAVGRSSPVGCAGVVVGGIGPGGGVCGERRFDERESDADALWIYGDRLVAGGVIVWRISGSVAILLAQGVLCGLAMLARAVFVRDLCVPLVYPANVGVQAAVVMAAGGGASSYGILASPGGRDALVAAVCFFELQVL